MRRVIATTAAVVSTLLLGPVANARATTPLPVCNKAALEVSFGPLVAAAGHSGRPVRALNVSQRACTMRGYPTVTASDVAGHRVAVATHTARGYLGGLPFGSAVPTITLDPGQTASALVEAAAPATSGACASYARLRAVVPNAAGVTSAFGLAGCRKFTVHPLVPGTTGRPTKLAPIPLVDECYPMGKRGQFRPPILMLACADGNFSLTDLHWAHWTAAHATGAGSAEVNGCTPSCAGGTFHRYAVSVELRKPVVRAGHLRFSEVVVTYVGARPPGSARVIAYPL